MATKRFDPDSDGKAQSSSEPASTLGNCRKCESVTDRSALSWRGGLCASCYGEYCRAVPAAPPIADKRQGDLRAWARLLLERHRNGEAISEARLTMARAALGMARDLGGPSGEDFDLRAAREAHDRKLADYVRGGAR